MKKFYLVWVGRRPGIYLSWQDCSEQVNQYPNARYMRFSNLATAKTALARGWKYYYPRYQKKKKPIVQGQQKKAVQEIYLNDVLDMLEPHVPCICVDGACNMVANEFEYRVEEYPSGKILFNHGPFSGGY